MAESLDADAATRAFHCAVLVEAHNKESPYQKSDPDPDRFARLVERDAGKVSAVLEAIARELPLSAGGLVIAGHRTGAEVALGIAVRSTGQIAGVYAKDIYTVGLRLGSDGELAYWSILDERIVRKKNNERARAALLRFGIPRVELFATGKPREKRHVYCEGLVRVFEMIAEQRARNRWRRERDELLSRARERLEAGKMDAALGLYARAVRLENRRGLTAGGGSAPLYGDLEAAGRKLLAEADALAPRARKAAYQKARRLFRGTPLEHEIEAALAKM